MTIPVGSLALLAFGLLGIGYVLFFFLQRMPKLEPIIKSVWPILWVETLIVGVVAGSLWIGGWLLTIVLLAHAFRVGFEAACVTEKRASLMPPMVIALLVTLISIIASLLPLGLVSAVCLIAFIAAFILRRSTTSDETAISLDLVLFPGLPLVVFTAAGVQGSYAAWLLLAFMMVETFDSYALLGGKLFGKRKAFPVLSPNKTIEGLACGLAMLIVTAVIAAIAFQVSIIGAIALAVFTAPLAVCGDLGASRLKRLSGVKDYPKVLPHQGGLFDTTDAWIAVGAGLVITTQLFGG